MHPLLFFSRPLMSLGLALFAAGAALAWQEPDLAPPEVPETRVEADPLAPPEAGEGAPAADPAPFPQSPPGPQPASILEGTIFDSPPADGYLAESTTTGTLFNVPQLQLPATVNVVPEAVIEDQQILNLRDALRNVPGAVPVGDGLFADRLFLRGLEVRTRDFRKNGFLDPTFTPRDFANIERVEILKGPASVLYGSAAPSGTVNFITKKPIDAEFSRFDYQFGGFGMNRFTVDSNGSLFTDESPALFRFNAAYENSDSYRDFENTERHLLAPALRVLVSDDTILTWEGEYIENRRIGDRGIPAIGGDALALPSSRYIGEPANDFLYTEDYRTSLVLQHQFANDWTLYAGAYTVFYEFPGSQTSAIQQVGPTQFLRLRQEFEDQENSSSLIVNLAGDTELAGFRNRLLFGTEHVYYDTESAFRGFVLPPIDAANPVYLNPPPVAVAFNSQFPVFRQVRHGYYFQDLLELNSYWQVMAGVRMDEVDFDFERTFAGNLIRTEQRFERTSPRAGIVFQPFPDTVSTYFNYSRSFNPPGGGGFPFTPDPVLPELGESYEAGVKTWLLDDLYLHTAWFHVTRENVPFSTVVFDPNTGAITPVYFQLGEERGQGAELELVGQVNDAWSLIANCAYTDTRLTDAVNPALFGQRQRNVPLNQMSIWSRHNVYADDVQTFGAALGVYYVDDRSANLADTVELPSYTRWDGGFYYQRGALDAIVYLENLFDEDYAVSSIDEFQIFPGAPFNVRAQIGATY